MVILMRQVQQRAPKIALVTAGFDFVGGVPTVARWLRDCLRSSAGFTVDIHDLATSSRDPYSRRLRAPSSWLRPSLRNVSGGVDAVVHWGANAVEIEVMRYRPRRELRKALQNYDLIQVVAGSPAWASAVIGSGVPIVLQVATTAVWERRRHLGQLTGARRTWRKSMSFFTSGIERRALRKVTAVLVENSAMLQYVRSVRHQRVIKAPPGIDTGSFTPALGGWRPDGYLLSVCRLDDARKGLERMVHAYAEMLRADHCIPPLVLAGSGRGPSSLLDLVANLGLSSRVAVRLNVSTDELAELYRGASVFLQTSYEEGLGMSVLEAMASGLPVVCTDTAGARETVVDGQTGWLIPQDNDSAVSILVAARVLEVLRGEGAAMGRRARQRCEEKFSNDVALQRFTDVYAELLLQREA